MALNKFIDNIYKRWNDIKQYIDSRIQFSSILDNKAVDDTVDAIDKKINKKQDKLTAGKNITIRNNVISADTDIKAGANISVTPDKTISAKGYTWNDNLYSFAEGVNNSANGNYSHAEGNSSQANGYASHAEGAYTAAEGRWSHAEGMGSEADGEASHAEGGNTTASGNFSHAEGHGTTAEGNCSHAEGSYNVFHQATPYAYGGSGNTQHSVGIGTASNNRKNAFEIMENGDAYLYGLGNYDGTNPQAATTVQGKINDLEQQFDDFDTTVAQAINLIIGGTGATGGTGVS